MKEIIAPEGMWLTQASIENENGRTFVKKIAGYGDLKTSFVIWADTQKEEWESKYLIEKPYITE